MESKRWHRVEQLYHRAQSMDHEARKTFLLEACGSDEELRRELESLLAYEPVTGNLLRQREARPVLDAGACFGPYRIVSLLGSGGMGDVYRALDTRLDRDVAIKSSRRRRAMPHPRQCKSARCSDLCWKNGSSSRFIVRPKTAPSTRSSSRRSQN